MARAVIFDFDGTLADTVDLLAEAWAKAASRLGIMVKPSDVEGYVGLAGPEISIKITGGDEDKAAELRRIKNEIYESEYLGRIKTFPDVPWALKTLRDKGLGIAVASSQSSRRLKNYLQLTGLLGSVDVIVGSDIVERRKPAPDVFLKAAELLRTRPEECVAVGDTCFDAESAKSAGMRFILVSRRGGSCNNADFTVSSLRKAVSIVLNNL
ncbi:MAG: HAD family hydrolase [Thermoproteota archaeon]